MRANTLKISAFIFTAVLICTLCIDTHDAQAADPLPSQLPSAPRSLTASPGNGKVTLTWSPPLYYNGSAISEYWIYRGTEPGGGTLWTTLGNVTTYTDIGLTNGQTYYYSVCARNAFGIGPRSSEVSATPRTTPSVPLEVSGIPGNLFINLTWKPPAFDGGAPILGYRIYRGTSPGSETFLADAGNFTFYICSRLQIGRTYYFRVSAYNVVGEGLKSNEVAAAPDVVPGAPIALVAKEGVRQITLTWSPPEPNGGSPILGYRILRGLAPGEEKLLTNVSVTTKYEDVGLTNNVTYYYKVVAYNAVGDGAESNEIFATCWDVPTPVVLSILEGNRRITLYWNTYDNGGTEVLRYWVYRGTKAGQTQLLITLDNVLSYTDTGLTNGQTYYYRIAAENAVGIGLSNEVCGTPRTVPSAPVGLTATPGERFIKLNWTKPQSDGGSPVLGYKIYRGLAPGSETFLADAGNVNSFIAAGLINGKTYYFKVSAYNEAGEGPLSAAVSEISGLVPSAPLDLNARAGDQFVYLSWSAPTISGSGPVLSYLIFRGLEPGKEAPEPIAEVTTTTYNNTGLTNGQMYYYKIKAKNAIGEGPFSSEVSAKPSTPGSAPSVPLNVQAVGGYKHILITWNPPLSDGNKPILGYKIYRGLFSGNEVYLATVSTNYYNNTALENDTTYYYRVAAYNEVGTGPQSEEVYATTQPNPQPPQPTPASFDIMAFLSNSVFLAVVLIIALAVIIWYIREKRKAKLQAKKNAERLKKSAKAAALKKGPGVK
ncbi:MAG: fibronectin type III domain-containing protein [Methanomassiliicoccales archaeon]